MQTAECKPVVGIFTEPSRAEEAMTALRAAGFLEDELGFAGPRRPDEPLPDTRVLGGATTGALAGGAVGGLVGVALGASLIPAVGSIVTGVLLMEILASAATGAAAGGILGALNGLGVSDEEAQLYDSEVKAGHAIVTVCAPNRDKEAAAILARHGAESVHGRA
jgi:hypothetical protein